MHNTRLSIFILPVLIIGLSVFTTFVEENPSFRTLFQVSQVANPSVNEEGQDLIDRVQTETVAEDTEQIQESDTREEMPADTRDERVESQGTEVVRDNPLPSSEEIVQNEDIAQQETTNTETLSQGSETSTDTTELLTPDEKEKTEQEIKDAELLALKLEQFKVTRNNISYKFEMNLKRLVDARDSLATKISQMEQNGADTTQAKDALINLDQAIRNSKKYINDSTLPDSVPGIQRVLTEYVKNVRDSIQEGYTALFNAVHESQ